MTLRLCVVLILASLGALLLPGCSVNPLLQDAGASGPSVFEGVPDAEPVTVLAVDGTALRGAHVEASPSAPVVLHLLPTGASVETGVSGGIGRIGLASTIDALREQGWSSVVFDYRGIGGSDGLRRASRLLGDGEAMWNEAVRVAGGHEDRVVIRAGSLGSLVVAHLLENGAEPAGVVVYAPIRSSSIVRNAIASHRGALWSFLTAGLYRSPGAPDLENVVSSTSVPLLLVLPAADEYLPADEAAVIAAAAESAGHTVAAFEGDHQTTILRSWGFVVDPDALSGRKVETLWEEEALFLRRVLER